MVIKDNLSIVWGFHFVSLYILILLRIRIHIDDFPVPLVSEQ